jgi:hypothetical protein
MVVRRRGVTKRLGVERRVIKNPPLLLGKKAKGLADTPGTFLSLHGEAG